MTTVDISKINQNRSDYLESTTKKGPILGPFPKKFHKRDGWYEFWILLVNETSL